VSSDSPNADCRAQRSGNRTITRRRSFIEMRGAPSPASSFQAHSCLWHYVFFPPLLYFPKTQMPTVRGGLKRDIPHVPTSAYPVPPSRRSTIPDFDSGCFPPGRAARLFLGRCGSRLTNTPTLCTGSAQLPPLHRVLLPRHGKGNSDWATSRRLRGTRLSLETVSANLPLGRRAPAIMSTIREIATVRSQQEVVPHFAT